MSNFYAMEESVYNQYLSLSSNINFKAVNKYDGERSFKNYNVVYHKNIGVINVSGIISRNTDIFAQFLGYDSVSVEKVAKDFTSLVENNGVKAIILDFDTPGGIITGVNELAEIIYEARKCKPVKAYVTGMACSAGYFLASACDEIIMDETAQVGSIGVIKSMAKKNNNTITFKSSQSPLKNIEGDTEAGKAEYQSKVDYLASIFINKVAKYRNITSDEVIKKGNYGSVLIGADAVSAGLADRLGSMDSLINELNNGQSTNLHESSATEKIHNNKEIEMKENEKMQEVNTADIERAAVEGERKRVSELLAITVPGCEAIINEAIKSGASLEETNARIIAHIQTDEYKLLNKNTSVKNSAVEPVVAGADTSLIVENEENKQVSAMLELAKSFNKSVR